MASETQQALVFFFGLFWSCVLSAVAPFHPFDTRLFFRGQKMMGLRRLLVGLTVVDALPVVALCWLVGSRYMEPVGVKGLAIAATLSMTVFSIQRFLHSLIASRRTHLWFYPSTDIKEGKLDSGKTIDGFLEHFIPGCGYVIFPLLIAELLLRFWK